jgi:hypothetical protein
MKSHSEGLHPNRRQVVLSAAGAIGGSALAVGAAVRPTPAFAAANVVDISSDQIIGGVKTFTSAPVLPAGSLPQASIIDLAKDLTNKASVGGPFAPSTTGASAPTRYVGGTASGAPAAGSFAKGDFVVDQTGNVWVCTVAGAPGTWVGAASGTDSTKVPLTQTARTGVDLPVFLVQPDAPARGPFGFTVGDHRFNSSQDFVGYFGYNASNGGQRYLDTEHSFAWVHESHYEVGPGTYWAESYTEYRNSSGGGSFRPWFLAIDKDTDIIQEHSFSGAPFTFKNQAGQTLADITAAGSLRTFGVAAQDTAWECRAPAGRTPQMIGMSGAVARFQLAGNADYQAALSVNNVLVALFQANGPANVNLSVGGDGLGLAAIVATPAQAAIGAIAARQFSVAQTAPILGIYNSDHSLHFGGFNRNGYLSIKKITAPSDTELGPNEMALWLDSTNGAAKLMVKAKEADGTVRTGSVPLS